MNDITTCFGPPGTGKTTYLSRQIERAADKFGPDDVIVASLTTTAAAEISSRNIPVSPEHIGTLHGICYRALGRPPLVYPTFKEFGETYGIKLTDPTKHGAQDDLDSPAYEEEYDEIYAEIDLLRARRIPEGIWPERTARLWNALRAWKQFTGTLDFTDMIELALDQFDHHPHNPAAIFYDEAQDGSALELALIKQWAAHTDHTIIAGDDDQTLYRWRGASVEDFLAFSERRITLSQSYRLPRAVWSLAQNWVQQVQVRHPKTYQPREEQGAVETCEATWSTRSLKPLLTELRELWQGDESIMILASCGYMLAPLLAELRKEGIPFHNPFRTKNGAWNPLRRGGKTVFPVDRVLAYSRLSTDVWGDDARPWTRHELAAWISAIDSKNLPHGSKKIIEKFKHDPSICPFDEVRSLLGPAFEPASRGDLHWFANSLLANRQNAHEFPLRVLSEYGRTALTSTPTITVGTIHSVKGGQADQVFLFPDLSFAGHHQYTSTLDGRDDVLRTLYVGITRARRRLVLCEPKSDLTVDWIPLDD